MINILSSPLGLQEVEHRPHSQNSRKGGWDQSLRCSINAQKRQEASCKVQPLAGVIEPIGYQRYLKADQRAAPRLRGNGNDTLQGANSLAHTKQPKAMGL